MVRISFLFFFFASLATASEPLVDVRKLAPSIRFDIRYATKNNFTKKRVYPKAECRLRKQIAKRLVAVQRSLKPLKLGLKVWDCFRPIEVQKKFWEIVPDERYVAKPVFKDGVAVEGSRHNRGAAVDLTLVDLKGRELEMPSGYDDFSEKAHRNFQGASPKAIENRALLEKKMAEQGFDPFATEWWHFDGPNWKSYPLE